MFKLTTKQKEANKLLASSAKHILLYGGSRSGKTFLWVRAMVIRALKSPGSRHAALRFRANAIKTSIVQDTFPKVMALCFSDVSYQLNMSDLFVRFENGSEIWFGGLDDKERVEKILGNEYATIAFNECSQIPITSRNIALTRLAQKCRQIVNGVEAELPLKAYYDENPPDRGHWTYRMFIQKINPDTKQVLPDAENYATMQLNPGDNTDNLPEDYIRELSMMSPRMQRRFLKGEFRDDNDKALFKDASIDKWRVLHGELPDMQRIIIAIDPSGSGDEENTDNDEIGIMVLSLGTDGVGYLTEDLTVKAGPATWGKVATTAFDRLGADLIVGETNYGGEMVKFVVQTARPKTPFKKVTATRGKVVRAEPISPLVEDGRIRLVGYFPELEEELSAFTANGYLGEGSPNRADAFIWAATELFSGIVTPRKEKKAAVVRPRYANSGPGAWMS